MHKTSLPSLLSLACVSSLAFACGGSPAASSSQADTAEPEGTGGSTTTVHGVGGSAGKTGLSLGLGGKGGSLAHGGTTAAGHGGTTAGGGHAGTSSTGHAGTGPTGTGGASASAGQTGAGSSASGGQPSSGTGATGGGTDASGGQPSTTGGGQPPAPDGRRLFLSGDVLGNLRARASAGTAGWTALKAECDSRLGGTVYWPQPKGDSSVNDYPDGGSIGEGYQGDGYLPPLLALSLCRNVLRMADPASGAAYAAKAVEILLHMSDPPGAPHYQDPLRDSGYGIRNYGVGLAIGYDWLHDDLTADQQAQVVAAIDHWITKYESGGFLAGFPHANYFAGYYAAKGLGALATDGENAGSPGLWAEWQTLHGTVVQPYYAAHVSGGGWAEGWNYGQLASLNMQLPILAARTAKGIDLVNDAQAPFPYVLDQGNTLLHFSWPSGLTLDDRGLVYAGANPTLTRASTYTVQTGLLGAYGAATSAAFHGFARKVRDNSGSKADAWQDFLFWDDTAAEADTSTLPLSYVAPGMGAVAMRSSWDQSAVWSSFVAGPYVGSPDSGEEFYDQGSVAVVNGDHPFVVNATGYLKRDLPGTMSQWDDAVYATNYTGNPPARSLYNVFYNKAGGQTANGPSQASTHVDSMEDGGSYVFSRGVGLEQLYDADRGVSAWTRDVVYLRPGTFLVHDRTTTSDTSGDPRMAFHLGRAPQAASSPSADVRRFDVVDGGTFVGAATTVFPLAASASLVDVLDSHKAYRLEVRPTSPQTSQRWLTVLDAAGSAAAAATVSPISSSSGNVLSGAIHGAVLASPAGTSVVVFGDTDAAGPIDGVAAYRVDATDADHLIVDAAPGATYDVTTSAVGGTMVVTVAPGGAFTASAKGVLKVHVSAGGAVSAG